MAPAAHRDWVDADISIYQESSLTISICHHRVSVFLHTRDNSSAVKIYKKNETAIKSTIESITHLQYPLDPPPGVVLSQYGQYLDLDLY
jgi:hypothetical protein